jgi:hypothetical protein
MNRIAMNIAKAKEEVRARVVAIYGKAFAAELEFLQ